jgi:beta-glucosidase/6-phospho-beta-glucosidase/beta-galactosidase
VYQSSGGTDTNWGEHEARRSLLGRPTIAEGATCGVASDFWNRYDEDIQRAADLGSNCLRFTFEWSRLQPGGPCTPLAADAVARYHQILDSLEARGLEPFVTLHQFVHPLWFEKLGSFLTEESISLFADYATKAFATFGRRVRFWTTFNEPGVASSAGFIYGVHPPGKLGRLPSHGLHMLHMLP